MKSSIKSIKISTASVSSKLHEIKNHQISNEERLVKVEESVQHVSDKFEEWVDEKAVLLEQVSDFRARYDFKCDEVQQYSCRSWLVLWGGGGSWWGVE